MAFFLALIGFLIKLKTYYLEKERIGSVKI